MGRLRFSLRTLLIAIGISCALAGAARWVYGRYRQSLDRVEIYSHEMAAAQFTVGGRSRFNFPSKLAVDELFALSETGLTRRIGHGRATQLGVFIRNAGASDEEWVFIGRLPSSADEARVESPFGTITPGRWLTQGGSRVKGRRVVSATISSPYQKDALVDALRVSEVSERPAVSVNIESLKIVDAWQVVELHMDIYNFAKPDDNFHHKASLTDAWKGALESGTSPGTIKELAACTLPSLEDGDYFIWATITIGNDQKKRIRLLPKCFRVDSANQASRITVYGEKRS